MRGQSADPALVTFRHLLTHTSGLAPWRDVYAAAGAPPTLPQQPDPSPRETRWQKALTALYNYPFVGQPGDSVRYSDLGLLLLGEAVARLHGAPLDVAVRERVLLPLGLESLTYNPVRNGMPHLSIAPTEYDAAWRKRRCWGEVHDENACGVGGVAGHAGLFGAVMDVVHFGQAWLNHDARLHIAPELMQTATQEQAVSDDERRGLGWLLPSYADSSAGDVLSRSSYGHTGFTGTSLWIDPARQLVIACWTNRVYPGRERPGIHAFRRALHDVIARAFPA